MNQIATLNLITGSFAPEEAQDILLSLFLDKIRFHQMRDFSSLERFGHQDQMAVQRIAELKKSIQQLNAIIKEAKEKNQQLEIQSQIAIFEKEKDLQIV